jgi:hypothetical protein
VDKWGISEAERERAERAGLMDSNSNFSYVLKVVPPVQSTRKIDG